MKECIFQKYSLRAFEWYVAWFQKGPKPKVIKKIWFSRNIFDWKYLENYKALKVEKHFFFGVTFKAQSIDISF